MLLLLCDSTKNVYVSCAKYVTFNFSRYYANKEAIVESLLSLVFCFNLFSRSGSRSLGTRAAILFNGSCVFNSLRPFHYNFVT